MAKSRDRLARLQRELDKAGKGTTSTQLTRKKKPYQDVVVLALDLGLQYEILRSEGYTFLDVPHDCVRSFQNGNYGLDLKKLDAKKLLVRVKSGKALIDRPFTNTNRTAPELLLTIRLPAVCSPTVALYALKGLCVEQLHIKHNLEAIMGTKLYFLLERCSRADPSERNFLFI